MKQYYTDKKYKELLSHLIVLVDTRDQTNQAITDWFDSNNIRWKTKALKTGDYGLMIESCPELGFQVDTYFSDELCIERKNSVSELAGNFANASKDDDRIFKELNRMINIERNYLLIENDKIEDIFEANLKLAKLPRNSSVVRVRNRCALSGRPRGYYRKFDISRIALRELASEGKLPGVRKSSW